MAGLLYFYLRKQDIRTSYGDAKRGYIFRRTRDSLLYLEQARPHPHIDVTVARQLVDMIARQLVRYEYTLAHSPSILQ